VSDRILSIAAFDEGGWSGYRVITDKPEVIEVKIINEQQCCEQFGYAMSMDNPAEFVGARLLNIKITDTARKVYDFAGDTERCTMFVDFETDRGAFQLVLYNSHNGYYGHLARITSSYLNEEECL
jgi:hypothetical protein